ncbi:hypothetical protein FOCC_FOCC012277 [Frankliniella occidentalis]|nr:hypothetical protein FOCC_FOCC012277 [Frankliniella occidentalis]
MSKIVATKLGFLKIDPEGKLCQIEEVKKEDLNGDTKKTQDPKKTEDPKTQKTEKKSALEQVVTKEKIRLGFPGVFTNILGKFNKYQVSIHADDTIKPAVCREPRLPLSRRKALEACVEEMQKDGVEVATGPTNWVSRPHLVPKKKSGWRMVVDMRAVNAALLREGYPIPTREEICKISGSKWFSSLDFEWRYLQFELKEDVRNLTTFVTHFGMFRFRRMAFGLSIAAEVCQRPMEDL